MKPVRKAWREPGKDVGCAAHPRDKQEHGSAAAPIQIVEVNTVCMYKTNGVRGCIHFMIVAQGEENTTILEQKLLALTWTAQKDLRKILTPSDPPLQNRRDFGEGVAATLAGVRIYVYRRCIKIGNLGNKYRLLDENGVEQKVWEIVRQTVLIAAQDLGCLPLLKA